MQRSHFPKHPALPRSQSPQRQASLAFASFSRSFAYLVREIENGERAKGAKNLLQGKEVPQAHSSQGHSVQSRQSLQLCSGKIIYRSILL